MNKKHATGGALVLATLLVQAAGPSLAAARYDATVHHHGMPGDHHAGCPFEGTGDCPHMRHDGRATLTPCGDDVLSATASATAPIVPPASATGASADRPAPADPQPTARHAQPDPDRSIEPPPPRIDRP